MKEWECQLVNDHIKASIIIGWKDSINKRYQVWMKYSLDGMA